MSSSPLNEAVAEFAGIGRRVRERPPTRGRAAGRGAGRGAGQVESVEAADFDPRDVRLLDDATLARLRRAVLEETLARAIADGDPDVLVREALQEAFGTSGEPGAPLVVNPSMIALGGLVKETGADKHVCKLFTIRTPDGDSEKWAWEEGETFVHSDHEKIEKLRRSVALHTAVEGTILIQHTMKKGGAKERHTRTSCRAWRVERDVDETTGELGPARIEAIPGWTPSHLPPPHGESDVRSYGSRD